MKFGRGWTWAASLAVGLGMMGLIPAPGLAEPAATSPSAGLAAAPTTAPSTRPFSAVNDDLQTTMGSLSKMFQQREIYSDAKVRAKVGVDALPLLKKGKSLLAEYKATNNGQGPDLPAEVSQEFDVYLVLFGDADTTAALETTAKGSDADADTARESLRVGHWLMYSKDAAAQGKILDGLEAQAKAHPESDAVAASVVGLPAEFAASDAVKGRLNAILGGMTSDLAKQAFAEIKAQDEADKKIHSFEGKPLVLSGTTVDGKPFTTADWKGKVILVDFWATWCGPCKEELPRVKKAYADFHAKGLEVLGVSNDQSADALKTFVAADPAMPWPQLFDADAAAGGNWNPTTLNFGINGIPTMFLIDKKGVLRTVDARENFEDLIPKMLAE